MDFLLKFSDADKRDVWRMYFPYSGRIHHRGKVLEFSRRDGEQMVSHFSEGVIGYDPPVTMLHDDTLGQLGVVRELRVGTTGVTWLSEFSDAGWKLAKRKGYKYMSPECVLKPNTYKSVGGKKFTNVAMGITLTPRPRLGKSMTFADGVWKTDMTIEKFENLDVSKMTFGDMAQFIKDVEDCIDELCDGDPSTYGDALEAFVTKYPATYLLYDRVKLLGLAEL